MIGGHEAINRGGQRGDKAVSAGPAGGRAAARPRLCLLHRSAFIVFLTLSFCLFARSSGVVFLLGFGFFFFFFVFYRGRPEGT